MTATALPFDTGIGVVDTPATGPLLQQRLSEVRRHRARTGVADTAIIVAAAALTATLSVSGAAAAAPPVAAQLAAAALVAAVWAGALMLLRSVARHQGKGLRLEAFSIVRAALVGIAALALVDALTEWDVLRPHLYLTIPVGVAALISVRLVRHGVRQRRGTTDLLSPRTLVVGDAAGVADLIRSLSGEPGARRQIVGVAAAAGTGPVTVGTREYPILGTPEQVAEIARQCGIETVVVAGGTDDPDYLRRLSWSLEGAATDLILATRLADVSRSRIDFERANGLALTHVSLPRYDHSSMSAKRALDVVIALAALVPIALITPLIALAVALDTPGGVFFRQRRIGRGGREFQILKFRTMSATAEADRAALAAQNEGAGPLFKLKDDPRVTRVGAILRRFSLDELPQFWNVLRGEMSVVGPRPPLPTEVSAYDGPVFRRLYVQPGITGLWQISGRSDLSWEQSVRLDLHYVENWSLVTDLRIILRTAAVMVRPKGAY